MAEGTPSVELKRRRRCREFSAAAMRRCCCTPATSAVAVPTCCSQLRLSWSNSVSWECYVQVPARNPSACASTPPLQLLCDFLHSAIYLRMKVLLVNVHHAWPLAFSLLIIINISFFILSLVKVIVLHRCILRNVLLSSVSFCLVNCIVTIFLFL